MKTNAKKLMFGLGMALLGTFATKAQVGLEGIIVEKYYQVNNTDVTVATNEGGVLAPGSIVYRVYVDMAQGWKYNLSFGNGPHPWKITTSTFFYNSQAGSDYVVGAQGTNTNVLRQGTRLIDSYLTVGGIGNNKVGIPESLDNDGSIVNTATVLANNPGGVYGLPINAFAGTAKDGLVPGVATPAPANYLTPNVAGSMTTFAAFDANQSPTGTFSTSTDAVAGLGGVVGTTTDNIVFIGQFTTDGVLGFELNIQVQNIISGATENWVANNVQPGQPIPEFTMNSLTLAPPTVTVTSPANGANFVTGSSVPITASATAVAGVTSIQFFVDGVSVGTDLTSPYSATYVATAGVHTIHAVVTDGASSTSASQNVTITAANNQSPTVVVSVPAGAITGQMVTFTATANDVDGTVASVSFSVDNVLIGSTTSGPAYTQTWTAVFGSHIVRASATDNLGAIGISAPVNFNVVNNIPPSVAIVSPVNNAIFTGTTSAITISATAADADGTVSSVEFFANGVSIGTVNASPYTLTTWTPTVFGPIVLKAVATDNAAGTNTSSPITINIANPNALPYQITSVKQECDEGNFCLPIAAASTYTVANVTGYDIVLLYDAARVTPTGTISVNPAIINPSIVTIVNSFGGGTMNISASFNMNAPANAQFAGTGEIFCVGFTKNSMTEVDTARFTIPSLDESYFIGVTPRLVSKGNYTTYRDTLFDANLKYWSTNGPIAYNSGNPNDFLITNIYGSSSVCVTNTAVAVQPDLNGHFTYNIVNGTYINISRDILTGTSVQLAINGNDAFYGRQVVLNTPTIVPSVYQIIALDVNLDGIVSSGDISQINQRSTTAFDEFRQAWNYNAAGTNTLGVPSKDYIFVDSIRIQTNPAYAISSNFPSNDNAGYSKFKVPSTPFCLPVTQASLVGTCPTINDEVYRGIMLGDVDGNGATLSGTLQLRPNGDKVVIDLNKGVALGNKIEVPVSFVSSSPVVALDFALQFDETSLNYKSVGNGPVNTDGNAFFNPNDKTLRFTATNVDLAAFNAGQPVTYIQFETNDGVIDQDQFMPVLGLLNGDAVAFEVLGKTVDIKSLGAVNSVNVYPNPTNGIINVSTASDATVQIFDMIGKEVLLQSSVTGGKTNQVDVSSLANGVYFVKISNSDFTTIKKVTLSK